MVQNTEFQKAVELITSSSNILVTSHTRPDGDACGSVLAMLDVLKRLGKAARPVFVSPLPDWYEFLFEQKVPVLGNDLTTEELRAARYDLVIIVDTNSYVQLPQFDIWLRETSARVLVIDHHVTGDGLGDVELIDTEAAAAGEIIFDLIDFAGWPISPAIAESLFVALAADTGWFRFANTDSRVFYNAARLIDYGANPAGIYRRLYQNFSPARLQLMSRMLGGMELYFDGRLAMQTIMQSDFEQTGSTGRDTENLIDECQRIGTVEVAALFVELPDGSFRCSLRSKGMVDVREIAQQFGGGGHTMAAGANLAGPLEKAKKAVRDCVAKQL